MAISTSGNSGNVLEGIGAARDIGAFTIGLTGGDGGKMAGAVDILLAVPSTVTARIQEAHILIEHVLCEAIDEKFSEA
jgi:D-sedoheptulose 7-phosphate isomerase